MTMADLVDPVPIVTIPIRPNLAVRIAPVPHDLTKDEAEKIARVVMAYVAEKQ